MLEILGAGLETAVQDYPGRVGFWDQGIPPSGPMDSLAFRLANLLVGNAPGAAGLEIQFTGPRIRFQAATCIAVTGANMEPKLNGSPLPMWTTVPVRAGDELAMSFARGGARAYLAVAGGIDVPLFLGSRSTFVKANFGGLEGRALKAGDVLLTFPADGAPIRKVKPASIPTYGKVYEVEVTLGPHDDWLAPDARDRFLSTEWKVSAKSDRTGYRLEGPEFSFSAKATNKRPENGSFPSNIIDYGYALGGVNLSGQTPIILPLDGPSLGGFINPFTVVRAGLWKVGQARPGDRLVFKAVSAEEGALLATQLQAWASAASLE